MTEKTQRQEKKFWWEVQKVIIVSVMFLVFWFLGYRFLGFRFSVYVRRYAELENLKCTYVGLWSQRSSKILQVQIVP